ncbi:protein SENESCENCE-ASSOCIATED GENE 21, mitochondrial-like [Salvia divinorum]|uniref:Protein SENESCENCE-ASSOCIATED GENE 21, mitochondrial-like n=1 Tax=Salvia divinorum TaxID=28513 RepID=A0ABD1GHU4_SALDI
MARSFSSIKIVSSLISTAVTRRGYSGNSGRAPNLVLKKGAEKVGESAWVPDPVTGYYRPEMNAKEMDPVELREMMRRKSKNNAK